MKNMREVEEMLQRTCPETQVPVTVTLTVSVLVTVGSTETNICVIPASQHQVNMMAFQGTEHTGRLKDEPRYVYKYSCMHR